MKYQLYVSVMRLLRQLTHAASPNSLSNQPEFRREEPPQIRTYELHQIRLQQMRERVGYS